MLVSGVQQSDLLISIVYIYVCIRVHIYIYTDTHIYKYILYIYIHGLPWCLSGKESPTNAGDTVSIPRSGRSPGEGNGDPLQYPCLGNPINRGAWRSTVCGVTERWTPLSN